MSRYPVSCTASGEVEIPAVEIPATADVQTVPIALVPAAIWRCGPFGPPQAWAAFAVQIDARWRLESLQQSSESFRSGERQPAQPAPPLWAVC